MKNNIALWDRVLRALVGIALAVLNFSGIVTGALGIVFLVISTVFLLTAMLGVCPLYLLFKFSTKKS